MSARPDAPWARYRPAGRGSRVVLVAPSSPLERSAFEAGAGELRRLGFDPIWDESVFDRSGFVAGSAEVRGRALNAALTRPDVDAVMAVRGGYGSVEALPFLDASRIAKTRTAFVGYSDVTSVHLFLAGAARLRSLHGPMLEGRLARGEDAYDAASFLAGLKAEPPGELRPPGLETLKAGEAEGPLFGGTLTQILASFETPFRFEPPPGHILFLDEVNERPYRLQRMLMQLKLSGRLAGAAGLVFGQLPGCDEPGGSLAARGVIADTLADFPGPILFGFPSGHTTTPLVSLPLGATVTVVADANPRLICADPAAEA